MTGNLSICEGTRISRYPFVFHYECLKVLFKMCVNRMGLKGIRIAVNLFNVYLKETTQCYSWKFSQKRDLIYLNKLNSFQHSISIEIE